MKPRLFLFLFIFILQVFSVKADKLEKAFECLRVYDYFNAKKYFEKKLEDDKAAAAFGLGKIYSVRDNPFYNPDTARWYILTADSAYNLLKEKEKKYYAEFGVTEGSIDSLIDKNCEDAFQRRLESQSLDGFNTYLRKFSTCSRYHEANLLRDSVAYIETGKINSSEAYKEFMARYPEAKQYKIAMDKFNERIYYENTDEKSLESYENFIKNYPENPFRYDAEKKIFAMSVPDKNLEQYSAFVRKYKDRVDTRNAWHELYRLFMTDYSMARYNNFKDSFPDYPYQEEFENDFRIQNYFFLPISRNNRWGYINEYGKLMIDPAYDEVGFFSEGLAAVIKNGKYGFINKTGDVVIDFQFEDAESFHNGAAIVIKDSLSGLINSKGDFLIPPMYEELTETSGDLYIASNNEFYGYIHKYGKAISPFEYDIAKDFKYGFAIVSKDEKYGLINASGNFIINPQYEDLQFLNDQLLKASNEDFWGIINLRGDTIVPFQYDAIGDISENRALVAKNDKCGYIDENGLVVIPLTFAYSSYLLNTAQFQDGFALLKMKTKTVLIDSVGKVIKFPGVQNYQRPSLGFIPIQKNKKWGFANMKGKIQIPCKYESVEPFSDTLAIFRQNKVAGLVDTSGRVFIQPLYQDIILLQNAIEVKSNNQWGLLSPNGLLYIPCRYDKIDFVYPEIIQASDGNGFTYINLQTGKIIYNPN